MPAFASPAPSPSAWQNIAPLVGYSMGPGAVILGVLCVVYRRSIIKAVLDRGGYGQPLTVLVIGVFLVLLGVWIIVKTATQ